MTRKRRSQGDPIEHEIELALNPGAFIPYGANFSFVSDLEDVAAKIAKLVSHDPVRAITLYETFLAACYIKIEELDDSSGSFGQFVDDLYCGWIKARQANKDDPVETASRLLTWMDQDDYGFCYHLKMDAVKVFNKANLAAFAKLVRTRFDAATQKTVKESDKLRERPEYLRRHWGEVLRTLYAAQKDVNAYTALSNFESAKRCFERAGQKDKWNKIVRQVRTNHRRKSSFMPGFERLVEGTGPSDEPSFIELAKARWNAKERRTR
jgi:hypothetical protein